MTEIIDYFDSAQFAGNNALSWVVSCAVAVGLFLLLSLVLRTTRRNLGRFSKNTSSHVDDGIVAVLGSMKPLTLLFDSREVNDGLPGRA